MCESEYTGPDCSQCANAHTKTGQCHDCQLGYYGPHCTACPGMQSLDQPCSGHGTCDGSGTLSGSGQCACSVGWAGEACDACAPGYHGDDCAPCPGPAGLPCFSHGVCSDGKEGSGHCACFRDFTGDACQSCVNQTVSGDCDFCPDGFWGPKCALCPGASLNATSFSAAAASSPTVLDACSDHGVCLGSGSSTGSGHCRCMFGFTGSACEECLPGHWGPNCKTCPGFSNADGGQGFSACSYHGTCGGPGSDGTSGICNCSTDWSGVACDEFVHCPKSELGPAFTIGVTFAAVAMLVLTYSCLPRGLLAGLILFLPHLQVCVYVCVCRWGWCEACGGANP